MIATKKYYLSLPIGKPNQGDIWINLPFPAYDIPFIFSLVITPRCDFVHEKADVFSYLPALYFDEYLSYFGFFSILNEEINRLNNALTGLNIQLSSFSLLEIGVSATDVLSQMKKEIIDKSDSSKRIRTQINKYEEIVLKINHIKSLLDKHRIENSDVMKVIKSKDITRHRQNVIHNQVIDLHFLPPCPPLLEKPLVLFLRHICTCHIKLLKTAHNSVNEDDWKGRCKKFENQIKIFNLCSKKPDRILRLRSPYLENLMNRIGFLFLRIGVPDFSKSEFKTFLKGSI